MEETQVKSGGAKPSREKKIATIASVVVFLIVLVLLTVFVGGPIVKTLGNPASFRAWVDARGFWGRVLFVGVMLLQVVIAFIPAEPLELAAGYAFGALWGTLLVWIGLVLGTTIVFLFVRKIGIKAVEVFFTREQIDSVKYINNERALNATAFILFLIPGTPKDLLTYLAGLTKIRLVPWIVLTSIARIPSIVTSTISGNALELGQYGLAIAVFAATGLVSGIGFLLYRRKQRKHALKEAADALALQPLPEYGGAAEQPGGGGAQPSGQTGTEQ
ncbi:MAG: TVP38/TMEM64 family protein [Christensenella sp.]|nr:TVP38/TMEM64 family protein [Christensenella sp.]